MPIPELERARVQATLKRFSERVPPHVRNELWYETTIRGNDVTLFECRPHFRDAGTTTKSPVAKFVFDPKAVSWSLRWRDRNLRWHLYDLVAPTRHFAELVAEVERDPTRIFFG